MESQKTHKLKFIIIKERNVGQIVFSIFPNIDFISKFEEKLTHRVYGGLH